MKPLSLQKGGAIEIKRKRGRPKTKHGKYQPYSDREKECAKCEVKKKIAEFPHAAGGTYKKSNICNDCQPKTKNKGYYFDGTYVSQGNRKPRGEKIFKPARERIGSLDPLAEFLSNNEGIEIDLEDDGIF